MALIMQVRRLVAHNVDFECLLESVPGWNKGVGTEVVRQHVRFVSSSYSTCVSVSLGPGEPKSFVFLSFVHTGL